MREPARSSSQHPDPAGSTHEDARPLPLPTGAGLEAGAAALHRRAGAS